MATLIQSEDFAAWLTALRDDVGKAHILDRLNRASFGNFGDCEPVGQGVSEMRIHHGPGYRIYFMRQSQVLYLLLCGGDKKSQRRDIAKALRMAKELKG
jgi:putative addiction module killer protein